jgi:hypothetical protein
MKRIDEKVKVGDFFHYKTGENVGVSPIELREKIKQALHL